MAKKIYIPKVTGDVSINITAKKIESSGDGLTLNQSSVNFTVQNETLTLITYYNGVQVSGNLVNWISSDESIVYVDSNGTIMALSNGTATISANYLGLMATCNITVNITSSGGDSGGDTGEEIPPEEPSTETLTLNQSSVNFTTQNETLTLIAYYNGTQISGYSVNWNSSNQSIVYIDSNGTIMAMANGTATISANYQGLIATCDVTVNITSSGEDTGGDSGENTGGTSNGIILEPKSMTITVIGQSRSIIATLSDGSTGTFNYSSSNTSVATVNNNGIVTSVGDGDCIITVTCGNYSATCPITVQTNIPCTSVYLSQPTLSFEALGQSKNLVGIYEPENSTDPISWTSSNTSVATVSGNGKVTSVASGTCTITFTCGSKSATCEVTVPDGLSSGGDSGSGGETTGELLYTNPTLVMEGVKAKASQNGVSQYFDVSHVANPGHSKYQTYKTITDSSGKTYYLALLSEGSSPFGSGSNHYDSGGWYSLTDIYGNAYESCNMPYALYNNTMNYTINNKNIASPVFNKALEHFNQTVPAINISLDSNSVNYIHRTPLEDTFYAVCRLRGTYFYIELNETTMLPEYGDTVSTSTFNVNDMSWVAIMVHELGHTLGLADHASHKPTIYDYSMDETSCTFLQPNDIAYLKYMWQNEFNTNLQTYQDLGVNSLSIEEPDPARLMMLEEMKQNYKPTDCFSYGSMNNIENKADVILNAQLKYNRTEKIDVSNGNDSIFEYHIYDIITNNIEKGELINKELKILTSQNIKVKENCLYKMYLAQYDNCPCSLINPYTCLIEL